MHLRRRIRTAAEASVTTLLMNFLHNLQLQVSFHPLIYLLNDARVLKLLNSTGRPFQSLHPKKQAFNSVTRSSRFGNTHWQIVLHRDSYNPVSVFLKACSNALDISQKIAKHFV